MSQAGRIPGPVDAALRAIDCKHLGPAHLLAVAALCAAAVYGGARAVLLVAALAALEVCCSFDNAVVNATTLTKLGRRWQMLFMTVGVLVAAVGVRLGTPLFIVVVAAHTTPAAAFSAALHQPHEYAILLDRAQPGVAGFGGIFLALLFLEFVAEPRERAWVGWVERPVARLAAIPFSDLLFTAFVAVAVTALASPDVRLPALAGIFTGLGCFLVIKFLGSLARRGAPADTVLTGYAGLSMFLYLELFDASFSIDSVMGAFSVTFDIVVIMLGLGVGAAYIRGLTVSVARGGRLLELPYLVHGAYYAIGALAVLLLLEIWWYVPDLATAGTAIAIITAAVWTSRRAMRSGKPVEHRQPVEPRAADQVAHAGPVE